MIDRGEPVCSTCGRKHSELFGAKGDRAVCSGCSEEWSGLTAVCWALHHAAATGHAAGPV